MTSDTSLRCAWSSTTLSESMAASRWTRYAPSGYSRTFARGVRLRAECDRLCHTSILTLMFHACYAVHVVATNYLSNVGGGGVSTHHLSNGRRGPVAVWLAAAPRRWLALHTGCDALRARRRL
jgi:hypothetical protein